MIQVNMEQETHMVSSSTLHAMFFTKIVLVPPTPLAFTFVGVLVCRNIINVTKAQWNNIMIVVEIYVMKS